MNQLITIALLFCFSYSMGLLHASAVLRLNNNVQLTLLMSTQRAAIPSRTSLNYPAVRQISGTVFEQEMKGIFEA
jgi:hypothetical protein